MAKASTRDTLEVALLPLANGRQLMVPLVAIAEVQQLRWEDGQEQQQVLQWRGYSLPVQSLDVLLRLPEPSAKQLTNVAVFKAHKDSTPPFRALAFCGNAGHRRITAESIEAEVAVPSAGCLGSTRLQSRTYLIPDLVSLLAVEPGAWNLQ